MGHAVSFENPPADARRRLLERVKTIAVVGLSPKPGRPSHRIALELKRHGYRIVPIRPAVDQLLGEQAYASIIDVPEHLEIDLVNVFRRSEYLAEIVDTCLARRINALWAQLGIHDEDAALRAQAAGMTVVTDRCIAVDHRELLG